jgi:hypothetical protein
MNLQHLEAALQAATPYQVAEIVVAAVAMLERVRSDDPILGTVLTRTILEPRGAPPEDSLSFYNSLEDILTATEAHRKSTMKQVSSLGDTTAVAEVDRHAKQQQNGLRLLMVALARKVDPKFKTKAHRVREPLFSAYDQIPAAVESLREKAALVPSLALAKSPDFSVIRTTAEVFALAFPGW